MTNTYQLLQILVWYNSKGDIYREQTLLEDVVKDFLALNESPSPALPQEQKGDGWIRSSDQLPGEGENVEISEDGINSIGTADYKSDRRCMLAGSSGGHGYFSEVGFATDGSDRCDRNLIMDTPKFWRRH